MKSLLKSIFPKDWLEEEAPATPAEEVPQQSKSVAPVTRPINLSSTVTEPVMTKSPSSTVNLNVINVPPSGKPDPKYAEFIMNELEKLNLDGIEYFEFSGAVREMIDSGTPVEQAFRNTFTALKVSGLTVDKLIETNGYYSGKLLEMQKNFEAEADGQIATKKNEVKASVIKITERQASLLREEDGIKKRLEEIAAERKQNDDTLIQLDSEVEQIINQQELRKSKMQVTNSHFVSVINDDLEKIKLYLQKTQ